MTLPLNVAVIGCGAAFTNLYLHPLRRMQRRGWIRVVALSEPSAARRQAAHAEFPAATAGATPAEAFAHSKPDLTIILSPPPQHLEHACLSLAAGSHVLCEKPVADTVESGRQMQQAAAAHGRLIAVGQTRRFYPCLATAKRLLTEGALGRVIGYSYSEGGNYLWPIASDAPFRRRSSGGGVLLDKGMHAVDILCWLFGPARVAGHWDDAQGAGVECFSKTLLDHGGVAGRLTLAWDQDLANACLIKGETGDLWIPNGPMHDLHYRPKGGAWQRMAVPMDFAAEVDGAKRGQPRVYYECFEYQLIQIFRAILQGEPVPVDVEQALVGLQVINTAYACAQPWEQPWLPAIEQARAVRLHWHQPS